MEPSRGRENPEIARDSALEEAVSVPTTPIEVFVSYSHEDERLWRRLQKQLTPLKRKGFISAWYDRRINAGAKWDEEIRAHLNSAAIILLLISPDFLASDYCYDVELEGALKRHAKGDASVIPVMLRPVDWDWIDERVAKLQVLPLNRKAVTKWRNRDEAFVAVAKGIIAAISQGITAQRPPAESSTELPILVPAATPVVSGSSASGKISGNLQRLTSAPVVALPGAVRNWKFLGEIAPGVFYYSFEKNLIGNWTILYMTSGDTPESFSLFRS